MRLVINLKIPKRIVREMDVYRKKYHPSGFSHSHSHITLVPPFVLKGKLPNLIDDINDYLRAVRPFYMQINGLGASEDRVLFFKPNCPPELKRIYTSLKKLIGENYRRRTHCSYWIFSVYRPHITIAKDSTRRIRQCQMELQNTRYKRRFAIIGIGLYAQRKDTRWILKKEFLFGRMN